MAGARYSLMRYGLPAEKTELRRGFWGVATLRLVSLARQDLMRTASFSERLRLTSNLSSGIRRAAVLSGELTVTAGARSQFKREIRAFTKVTLSAGPATDRAASLELLAQFGGKADLSLDAAGTLEAGEHLSLDARLTGCLYRAAGLGETVDGAALACADVSGHIKGRAALGLLASSCKDLPLVLSPVAILALRSELGRLEGKKLLMADGLRVAARVVKDYARSAAGSSGLYLRAASGYLDQEVITIRCTIPPGGTLVIDTERYTATLNGENVLHLQEGDWPRLSRELVSLSLSSGTGGALDGRVTYQEAYL